MLGIKLWGLLEDGSIEPLYYGVKKDTKSSKGLEPRWVEQEKKKWFLQHDRYMCDKNGKVVAIATCYSRIIEQSDDLEEIIKLQQIYLKKRGKKC